MRNLITLRPRSRDFTIPNWAFLLIGREDDRPAARRLARAVVRRAARRRRLTS
jgi:hypothetical protein